MALFARGDIRTAVKTLRRNKARSVLTMLGIVIAVMSVVMVVSISEGVKSQVNVQTEHLGKDLITIRPGEQLEQPGPGGLGSFGQLTGPVTSGALSSTDLTTVSGTSGVAISAPLSVVTGGVVSGETSHHYNAFVIGTSPTLPALLNQTLAYGAFFSDDPISGDKVVIGSQVAQALFEENVPLGQTLTILEHRFIVVGIFNSFQTAPLSVDTNFNNAVFIPYSTAEQITNNSSPIYEILARPVSLNQTDQVVGRLNGNLLRAHGGQQDFTVLEQSQTRTVTSNILNLLTALTAGIAIVALLVGGVGIMNVMLVSVTERMHEIGIRKAVGATNRQILVQFMTEAAVLSIAGGIIGVALSLLTILAIRVFTNLTPMVSWRIMVLGCAVSVVIGICFGSMPALKAARKDPISALRNE